MKLGELDACITRQHLEESGQRSLRNHRPRITSVHETEGQEVTHDVMVPLSKKASELEQMFQEYNRLYFQGRLRPRRIYRAKPSAGYDYGCMGECVPGRL